MKKTRLVVLVALAVAIPKSGIKKGAEEMNKLLIMITVFFVLSLGFVTGSQAKIHGSKWVNDIRYHKIDRAYGEIS